MATHSSGNVTWVDYPSTATPYTAATSEKTENAIDFLYTRTFGSLTRTTPQIIEVRYQGTSGGVAANSDTFITGNWVASRDTDSMYFPGANPVYMQAALAGRFVAWFEVHWKANTGFQACKLTKNGTSVTANSLLSDSRPAVAGNEGTKTMIRREVILAGGDKLYPALFSSVATSIYGVGDGFFGGVFTAFGMRWIAPS